MLTIENYRNDLYSRFLVKIGERKELETKEKKRKTFAGI